MTGVNVDYTLMGGQWDNSRPITFSVAPDGVAWDNGTNNVNATLNGEFGGTSWQRTLATALQTWAASANLNFVPVADGNYGFNTQGANQGDSRFGDIRVAGYGFTTQPIAQTYGPPPNGWTAAGDVKLNTNYTFGPTGQWDLESVLIHELGHSLGLGESPQPDSDMYEFYSGVRHDLNQYDVEGIQSIYGPRLADSYQSRGQAVSTDTAADLTGAFNSGGLAVVPSLSLRSIGASEYFSVTAPQTSGGMLQVNAVADGISLLSPKVTVIDAATGAMLASTAHPDQYGDTATVYVPGTQPGHKYLIVVTGATQDVFSVGNYTLQAAFTGGTSVAAPVATTTTPSPITGTPVLVPVTVQAPTTVPSKPVTTNPVTITTRVGPTLPTDAYAANTTLANPAELGSIAGQSLIRNVTLQSGQDVRVFAFEPARAGLVYVASANTTILIGDSTGHPVASGRGMVGFMAPTAGARYFVVLMSPNNAAVADASFAVQVVPVATTAAAATPVTTTVQVGHTTPTTTSGAAKKQKRHRHH